MRGGHVIPGALSRKQTSAHALAASTSGCRCIVSHDRYVTFQMAEVAVPRQMFADILSLIVGLRAPPAPA
jgi:hypothetical protein